MKDRSAPDLPEGTVTFLFTDIEGSTQLLDQLGDGYISLLADHHRILRKIFDRWNGREEDTEGMLFLSLSPGRPMRLQPWLRPNGRWPNMNGRRE